MYRAMKIHPTGQPKKPECPFKGTSTQTASTSLSSPTPTPGCPKPFIRSHGTQGFQMCFGKKMHHLENGKHFKMNSDRKATPEKAGCSEEEQLGSQISLDKPKGGTKSQNSRKTWG